ncbi:MAG: hypothetical protein H3C49_11385 [Alphaproteobacteria bacterium]|nr:hypothetical protein [Alphaproteobacteria bacterium]
MAALDFSAAPPQMCKNGGFIGFFAKAALLGENENQLQNPCFETFAINTAPQ